MSAVILAFPRLSPARALCPGARSAPALLGHCDALSNKSDFIASIVRRP